MYKPTVFELSQDNKYNRYQLVMAASKGARYVIDRDNYEKEHPELEQYKSLTGAKGNEKGEIKPVMEAIDMLYHGDICIKPVGETAEEAVEPAAEEAEPTEEPAE